MSVWISHFRSGEPLLVEALNREEIVMHNYVLGALAMGNFKNRERAFGELEKLPRAVVADHDDVMRFVSVHRLYGLGIGYVDAHLLAAARLTPGTMLWAEDKRMNEAAVRLGVAWRGMS